jgi:tRNA (mo5U34)-methyltransferase
MTDASRPGLRDPAAPRRWRSSDLRREVEALGPWFHNLHLPGGLQTMPNAAAGDFPAWRWQQFASQLPEDLTGWQILDIGCNAGFYCFELARRGAEVTGLDANSHYLAQARWAARVLGLEQRVSFEARQVHDLAGLPGRYDVVLFMGLFHHLRYPLLALDLIAQKTTKLLIFQSFVTGGEQSPAAAMGDISFADKHRLDEADWPRLAFVEGSFARDASTWWVPNHAAVVGLLRSCGLKIAARAADDIYLAIPDPEAGPRPYAAELAAATGRRGR